MLSTILVIAAILVGLLCTLFMIVMFCAGAANASPTAIQQAKWFLASVVFVQVLSLASSISLLIIGRDWLACGAGILPVPYAVALVALLVKLEW